MSYEDVDHIVKSCLKFKDLIGDEKLSFNDVFMELFKTKSNSGGSLNKVHFCIVYVNVNIYFSLGIRISNSMIILLPTEFNYMYNSF